MARDHSNLNVRSQISVRCATGFTSEDIHHALFGSKPPAPKTLKQMKEGVAKSLRKRYALDSN